MTIRKVFYNMPVLLAATAVIGTTLFTSAPAFATSERHSNEAISEARRFSPRSRQAVEQALGLLNPHDADWNKITTYSGADGVDYADSISSGLNTLRQNHFYAPSPRGWQASRGKELLAHPALILGATELEIRMLLGMLASREKMNGGGIGKAVLDGIYFHAQVRLDDLWSITDYSAS